MNIFEIASKKKLRFKFRGLVSTEDLWDLSLKDLNIIFKELNSQIKETKEESLLNTKSDLETELDIKIQIIKHIFETKLKEQERRKKSVENKAKKQRILEIIQKKKEEDLESKDINELQEMLDDLE